MRCLWNRSRIMALAASLAVLVSSGSAHAQGNGGGKPPKGDPPPASLPTAYRITNLGNLGGESIGATGANESGYLVGYAKLPSGEQVAIVCDTASGQIVDLNTFGPLVDPASPTDTWTATDARDINELNQIVGTARRQDGQERAFVLDLASGQFTLFPFYGLSGNHATGINDLGTVVFHDQDWNVFQQAAEVDPTWTPVGGALLMNDVTTVLGWSPKINNDGVIVAASSAGGPATARYDPASGSWDTVLGVTLDGAGPNASGAFAGRIWISRNEGSVVRFWGGILETIYSGDSVSWVQGFNDYGDVVFKTSPKRGSEKHFVYMDIETQPGVVEPVTFSLDDAVAAGGNTQEDLSEWQSRAFVSQMTNRGPSGFPTLYGAFGQGGNFRKDLIVLTPVPAP